MFRERLYYPPWLINVMAIVMAVTLIGLAFILVYGVIRDGHVNDRHLLQWSILGETFLGLIMARAAEEWQNGNGR